MNFNPDRLIARLSPKQWVVLFFIGTFLLRLPVMLNYSMWLDDGASLESLKLTVAEQFHERIRMGHFPWYFMALNLWSQLAGMSQFALRIPSLLAVMLTLPAILWLAHRIGGIRALVAAGFIYMVHGTMLRHCAELRPYSWMVCAAAWMLVAAFRFAEFPSVKRGVVLGLLHLALIQLHVGSLLWTTPTFLAFYILTTNQEKRRAYYSGIVLTWLLPLLATVPLLVYMKNNLSMREYEKFIKETPFLDLVKIWYELVISMGESGKSWEFILILIPVLGMMMPLAVGTAMSRGEFNKHNRTMMALLVCAFGCPLLAWIISITFKPILGAPRYYIMGTAPVLVILAVVISQLRIPATMTKRILLIGFLLLLGIGTERMFDRTRKLLFSTGMGLNTMAEEMKESLPPGNVVIICDAGQVLTLAAYYFGDDTGFRFVELSRKEDAEKVREILRANISPTDEPALYLYRAQGLNGLNDRKPPELVTKILQEEFGPWSSVVESKERQPRWVWFRR